MPIQEEQRLEIITNAYHSQGVECDIERARRVDRAFINATRRLRPEETAGLSDEEVWDFIKAQGPPPPGWADQEETN